MGRWVWLLFILVWLVTQAVAEHVTLKIQVNGVERSALVYPGKASVGAPSPLILAFHGYGSNAKQMASYGLHEAWPEATVVYPQGLIVRGRTTGREEPGWQHAIGESDNRDLQFVDALLTELHERYVLSTHRVYAAGMSNGALFCYVLLAARPEKFAAFAPVSGASTLIRESKIPRPLLMIHGKNDHTMPLEWAEWTCDYARLLNGCGRQTKEWDKDYLSYQPCTSGQPVIWHVHNGGHEWPDDATDHIVRFFKEHALPGVEAESRLW